jgi:hypothetical protein
VVKTAGIGEGGPWLLLSVLTLPFWFFTLFTSFGWAFRQWLLVVPIYIYCWLNIPVFLGWVFSTSVSVFALHNYPGKLHCGTLHIVRVACILLLILYVVCCPVQFYVTTCDGVLSHYIVFDVIYIINRGIWSNRVI